MRPYSSGYLPHSFLPPCPPFRPYICAYVRAWIRGMKKKELGFIPQNCDKSGNIYPSYKYDDPDYRYGQPRIWHSRIYSYLGQEEKRIERFRSPFSCPIWKTRDASLRQINSRRLPSIVSVLRDPDSRRFYGCSDARQTEHTLQNADRRDRQNKKASTGYTRTRHPWHVCNCLDSDRAKKVKTRWKPGRKTAVTWIADSQSELSRALASTGTKNNARRGECSARI